MLTDLKSGYLLGSNPRQQTIAQFFGVLAGTLLCVPIYTVVVKTPAKDQTQVIAISDVPKAEQDSVQVNGIDWPFEVLFSINTLVTIGASSEPVTNYSFNTFVLEATTLNELQSAFYARVIEDEARDLREQYSFFEYLLLLVTGIEENDAVLVLSHNKRVSHDDAVIYMYQPKQTAYRTVRYEPISWQYLFK